MYVCILYSIYSLVLVRLLNGAMNTCSENVLVSKHVGAVALQNVGSKAS